MTTAQLNSEIWHSMSIIADDEGLMRRAAKYLRNLAAEKTADPTEMSREEFFARVDAAKKGKSKAFSNIAELDNYIRSL